MTNQTKRGLCIFIACATFNIMIFSLYYIVNNKAFAFIDIGADTYTYYYPIQIEIARQLHDLHLLTWSFSAGLGNYIGWQSNLIFLLEGLFPETWQLGLRLPAYMLMLLLAGTFMFGYLRKIGFMPYIACAGSLAYAFCGYATINGQWDTQGYVLLQLSAYLLCFECYFRERKAIYAILAGLVVATGGAFDTYTFTVFTLLYVIARPFLVSQKDDVARFLPSLLKYICWSALGSMLVSLTLIPNIIYLLQASRVTGTSSNFHNIISNAFSLTTPKQLGAEISGFLGRNIFGVGSDFKGIINWFEAPGFYVGVLFLICIPQLFAPNATNKGKRFAFGGVICLVAYIISPFFRNAVYGFGHYGYRLSSLWISLLILMLGIVGLRHIYYRGTWRFGLLLSTVLIIAVTMALTLLYGKVIEMRHVLLLVTFAVSYCFLLWPTKSGMPRAPILVIVLTLTSELAILSLPSFTHRTAVDIHAATGFNKQGTDTADAIRLIKKHESTGQIYRIAKTYGSGVPNEPMVIGYYGTTSYFLQGKSTTNFFEGMGLQNNISNIIKPITNHPNILDLLGVKYVLTTDHELPPDMPVTFIGRSGIVRVFRNDHASSIARLYHAFISRADANTLTTSAKDNLILRKLIVANPLDIQTQLATIRTRTQPQANPTESVSVRKVSDVHLVVHTNSTRPSAMLVAIPFSTGWSASLDSTKVQLFRADYGLTALLVPQGSHIIDLRYVAPGRTIGKWLSITAILLLASMYLLHLFVRHRKLPLAKNASRQ